MADKFDPWGAAATYVGAKAKENPACSDADAKLLQSIGGHGSEANFEKLGGAIDAAGGTVEKLAKTSKHHAEIAKNEKEKAEDALAAKRAKKDLDAEESTAADDLKRKDAVAKKQRLEAEADLNRTEFCVAREAAQLKKNAVFMTLVEEAQILKMMALTPQEAYDEFEKMDLAEQANYLVGGALNWQATGGMREAHIPRAKGSMVGMAQAIDCGPNTAFAVCETVQKPTLRVLASRHASVGHLI
jgi:hypothetical protein